MHGTSLLLTCALFVYTLIMHGTSLLLICALFVYTLIMHGTSLLLTCVLFVHTYLFITNYITYYIVGLFLCPYHPIIHDYIFIICFASLSSYAFTFLYIILLFYLSMH